MNALHTGRKIGNWSLIDKVDDPSRLKWLCLCTCGTRKVVRQDHLLSGQSRGCGCARAAMHAKAIAAALESMTPRGTDGRFLTGAA